MGEGKHSQPICFFPQSYLKNLNGHFAALLYAFPGYRIRSATAEIISDLKCVELTAVFVLASPHSSGVTAEPKTSVLYNLHAVMTKVFPAECLIIKISAVIREDSNAFIPPRILEKQQTWLPHFS